MKRKDIKVGMKVRLNTNLDYEYVRDSEVDGIKKYEGKIVTIENISGGDLLIKEISHHISFYAKEFSRVVDEDILKLKKEMLG